MLVMAPAVALVLIHLTVTLPPTFILAAMLSVIKHVGGGTVGDAAKISAAGESK